MGWGIGRMPLNFFSGFYDIKLQKFKIYRSPAVAHGYVIANVVMAFQNAATTGEGINTIFTTTEPCFIHCITGNGKCYQER
jgi:hypothetical protein